jgi:hypothetical protein
MLKQRPALPDFHSKIPKDALSSAARKHPINALKQVGLP